MATDAGEEDAPQADLLRIQVLCAAGFRGRITQPALGAPSDLQNVTIWEGLGVSVVQSEVTCNVIQGSSIPLTSLAFQL